MHPSTLLEGPRAIDPAAAITAQAQDPDLAFTLYVAFAVIELLVLLSGTVGVAGLVVGCTMKVQETRLAVQSLAEEAQLAARPIDNP